MIFERSILLSCRSEQCIAEVMTPRLLQFVAAPLITLKPVDPPMFPKQWSERKYRVTLNLFGIIPIGQHIIKLNISYTDPSHFKIRDNGGSHFIQKWDHLITIQPVSNGTFYTDRVEVNASYLTFFVWLFANVFYRHRQRRWKKLVDSKWNYD